MSRSGAGSPALCLPCWRSDQDRAARAARRRQVAQGWDEIADLDCPMCGPAPAADCWWCGDRSWLAGLRWVHEQDQAAAAAAEAARVDAEFARIAAVHAAEATVADLAGWRDRIRDALTRYHAGSGGRAVELLADALARDAAARTSARGRPAAARALVAAVLAMDADWRSGRRAMPGRARTAQLVAVSERAVSDAFRAWVGMGWAVRTCQGGRTSLERRKATGRSNDRAVFDLCPLSRSPIDPATRAAHIPLALAQLGQVLALAQQLLAAALAELDALRADGPPEWAEHARRANARQDTRRVLAEVATPAGGPQGGPNICTPHPVTTGECVSSCPYRGLLFSRPDMIHSPECPAERPADGRRKTIGASRSPTKGARPADRESCRTTPGRARPPVQRHPSGPYPARPGSVAPQRRARPSWAAWAYDLARELVPAVPWLDGARLPAVAAVLGARLGPDWTVPAVLTLLPQWSEPDRPLAFLAALLDRALTGDQAPPYPARRHDAHRRAVAGAARATASARLADTLAELDTHAAGATGAGLAAFRAARAQLGRRDPEPWPAVTPPGGGLPEHWQHGTDRHDQPGASPAPAARPEPRKDRR